MNGKLDIVEWKCVIKLEVNANNTCGEACEEDVAREEEGGGWDLHCQDI